MTEKAQPLAEVFGHLVSDISPRAVRHRQNRLCPFNNAVPNCTKDKANDPLGVCSVYEDGQPVITCPVRFREDWLIIDDAAAFFFPPRATWTSLTEVRLPDADGKSAGNIDLVLVSYDRRGRITDFGALEVQAVYISGNVREPFEDFMADSSRGTGPDWSGRPKYPRPDYLSSSRKRLAPQLLFKGGILNSWQKKMAVALGRSFYNTLPPLKRVDKDVAEIAWLLYDLELRGSPESPRFCLTRTETVYTDFEPTLAAITSPNPGQVGDFMKQLQSKLDERLEAAPSTSLIERPF